jgi:hypothetical protein
MRCVEEPDAACFNANNASATCARKSGCAKTYISILPQIVQHGLAFDKVGKDQKTHRGLIMSGNHDVQGDWRERCNGAQPQITYVDPGTARGQRAALNMVKFLSNDQRIGRCRGHT